MTYIIYIKLQIIHKVSIKSKIGWQTDNYHYGILRSNSDLKVQNIGHNDLLS